MKKEQVKKEQRIFTDPSIPAGLLALGKSYDIKPFLDSDHQVKFAVTGENIDHALELLCSNAKVGFMDVIKNLKGLRSSIFALKAGKK